MCILFYVLYKHQEKYIRKYHFNHILVQYNLFWVLINALHATESFTRTLAY